MKNYPVELVDPFYRWLDYLIADYGVEIYLVMVWLSPMVIAWVLSGGCWRRQLRRRGVPPPLPQAMPPPLALVPELQLRERADENIQSFAA